MTTAKPVVEAIAEVMRAVREVRKTSQNTQQGFNFRGIDAVMNAVGPALREHGVIVMPTVEDVEYTTVEVGQRRTPMAACRVKVTYTFHGPAGTDSLACTVIGEAMDSGDKAGAKAMSVAFRTALLQALCLPTDDPDPDHEVYERSPARDLHGEAERALQAAVAATDVEEVGALWRSVAATGLLRIEVAHPATGEVADLADHLKAIGNTLKAATDEKEPANA